MAPTVLVTGGTGYVASWCIAELLKRGYLVRATVRDLKRADGVRAGIAAEVGATDGLTFYAADLTRDDGWAEAVAGCDYVLHVASPLNQASVDFEALIGPARDGTLRVLKAALTAGVKRVVMTSSGAAATPSVIAGETVSDEAVWTDPEGPNLNAYRLSKIHAERAAWDFVTGQGQPSRLTTILPVAIFGPVLLRDTLGSVAIIQRLVTGRIPFLARFGFSIVDVRDLAELHIRAMESSEAAGQRFTASAGFLWMADIARVLRRRLGERGRRVPTLSLPDFAVRLLALVVAPLRELRPLLGRKLVFPSVKARQVLGFAPRPVEDTVVDCAESLFKRGG